MASRGPPMAGLPCGGEPPVSHCPTRIASSIDAAWRPASSEQLVFQRGMEVGCKVGLHRASTGIPPLSQLLLPLPASLPLVATSSAPFQQPLGGKPSLCQPLMIPAALRRAACGIKADTSASTMPPITVCMII